MLRSFFEIIYLSLILYICFLYHKLFLNVVKLRKKNNEILGSKNKQLERAVRAHANFCETVPINFLISFILYFNNLIFFSISLVLLLAIGRTIHSSAISNLNENINHRKIGMKFTNYALFVGILGIIYYVVQLVYFNWQYLQNTT